MFRALKGKMLLVAAVGLALAGCTQSQIRLEPDFGAALMQNKAAQIADPDAHYVGTPAPGSNGARVGLAQRRYESNRVIPPSGVGASSPGSVTGFDNTANNASSGAGVGMAGTVGP